MTPLQLMEELLPIASELRVQTAAKVKHIREAQEAGPGWRTGGVLDAEEEEEEVQKQRAGSESQFIRLAWSWKAYGWFLEEDLVEEEEQVVQRRSEAAIQAAAAEVAMAHMALAEVEAKVNTAEVEAAAALDAAAANLGGEVEERMSKAAQVVAETQEFIRKTMASYARSGKGGAAAEMGMGAALQKLSQQLLPFELKLHACEAPSRDHRAPGGGGRR